MKSLRKRKGVPFIADIFYKKGNECRVLADYGDFYIDTYSDGKLKTTFILDLGDNALPEDMKPKTYAELDVVDDNPKYFKCITSAYETDDWLFLQLVGPEQKYYHVCVNKNNGKYVAGAFPSGIGLAICGANDKYFYAMHYPEFVNDDVFTTKIIEKMQVKSQNPILIKFYIDEKFI